VIIPADKVLETLSNNPEYRDLLVKAVMSSNGRQTFGTLAQELVSGRAQLWARKKSLIVTQELTYPTGAKWLSVRIGTGNMGTLKAMMGKVEEYAKDSGFIGVESVARNGWSRVGEKLGYKKTHEFIEKEF